MTLLMLKYEIRLLVWTDRFIFIFILFGPLGEGAREGMREPNPTPQFYVL